MSDKIRRHRIEAEANFPAAALIFSAADPPPPDRGWFDKDRDLLKALKISYWSIKIVYVLGQLLGLLRERLPARRVEARVQRAATA